MKTLASILFRAAVSAILLMIAALVAFIWLHTAPGWLSIVIILALLLGAIVLLAWILSPLWRKT